MSEAEKKSIITILRSLVNSMKNASLNDLARDYSQLEGGSIPFRKFGFSNLPDFLVASGQFYVTPYQTVIASISAESAHISKLVAEQNPGKKKKVKRFVQPQRHLHPTTTLYSPPQPHHGSAMLGFGAPRPFTTYPPPNHQAYINFPPAKPNNFSFQAYNAYHHKNGQNRNYSVPQNGTQMTVPKRRENQPSMTFTFADLASAEPTNVPSLKPETTPNPPIASKPAPLPVKPIVPKIPEPTVAKKPQPSPRQQQPVVPKIPDTMVPKGQPISVVITNNKPPNNARIVQTNPPPQVNAVKPVYKTLPPLPPNKPLSTIHSRLIIHPAQTPAKPTTANVQPPAKPTIPISTIQQPMAASPSLSKIHSRLNVRSEALRASPLAALVVKQEPNSPVIDSSPTDTVMELAQYAKRHGWKTPKYSFIAASMTCKIEVRITLNGTVYSSLPRTFDTTFEGKKVMSRDLLSSLTKKDAHFTNENILERLHEWLKLSPNGMFIQNIPELFRQKQNLALPADWITMVKQMTRKFSIIVSCGNNEILYAETSSNLRTDDLMQAFSAMTIIEQEPTTVTPKSESPSDDGPIVMIEPSFPLASPDMSNCELMDKLVLPWQEKSWNVTITNAKSTVEIWARLIGPEYSSQLDDLMVDIEMDIMHDKKKPKSLTVGNIYLAVSVYTYRVRIERTDFVQAQCLCFCVDSGVEEWYSTDQLFECPPQFVKFPAQAICLSLFGLGDCAGHPNASSCLEDALADQSLIADILCLQADYEDQLSNPNQIACIKTILYDTSSTIDVQLNDVLLNDICSNSVSPVLAEGQLNGVTIAHISDNGDIYCHLTSQLVSMQFLQSRIGRLFSTTRAPFQMINTSDEITPKGLYLVQDTVDGQWYRANVQEEVGKLYRMFYVDVGKTQTVDKIDLYCLNSFVLGKFPFQAIVFRLGDVGDTNPQMVTLLRDYLRAGSDAMVRVLPSLDCVPKAKVFMRFQNGPLICVNDSINLEAEIKM